MPAEYEPHAGTIVIFPERKGSWIYGAAAAQRAFCEVIRKIAACEKVYVVVSRNVRIKAYSHLFDLISKGSVTLLNIETNDSWARDTAPTFVTDGRQVRGVNWTFNAWGGEVDGLYKRWLQDDRMAKRLLWLLRYDCYDASPFVLEGGSVHSNGKGTVITTEECLLSAGRNPSLSKEEIEQKLKDYLGCERVVWLPYGICGDETNGHVDNICAFVNEDTVLLAWTEEGEQGVRCAEDLKVLRSNGLKAIKLPLPQRDVRISEYEAEGFIYEAGETERTVGERLAASYVNFYVCNAGVLVPQFGDINDAKAVEIISAAFPDRSVIGINAHDIIVGGGNIHCITQQIPEAKE